MLEFKVIEVPENPYLYVERTSAMDTVPEAMQSALGEVWAFMEHHGVPASGGALSVYYEMPADPFTFRTGFLIRPKDVGVAQDAVKADTTPAGQVLHFTHRGPYSELPAAYGAMAAHLKTQNLVPALPSWEVYLNDPREVHEEQLLTDIYQALA
jgi:effector-binding domain-containing protein